jgi:hypothetical protein
MLAIISCSTSVGYINDGIEKYAPTSASTIKVYSEKKQDQKYLEIGYVSANMTSDVSGDELKRLLKEKAAELGADAIVEFKLWGSKNGGIAEGIAVKYIN